MLHREDPHGLIVITQPAHAWLAGQLARAWGNPHLGEVAPWEEVCLGTDQHDVGWTAWEAAPTLNPSTGRPHRFTELPLPVHLGLWSTAARSVLPQGRYPALLVSLHGAGLYERRDYSQAAPEEAQAAQAFLAREHAFQAELLASLRDDPYYAPSATPAVVARNRHLVRAWDSLSLALCGGLHTPRSFAGVPAADGDTTLMLTPLNGDPTTVMVDPWPFRHETVTLVCEGRRLPETFAAEETMRAALDRAPWVTIRTRLRPA